MHAALAQSRNSQINLFTLRESTPESLASSASATTPSFVALQFDICWQLNRHVVRHRFHRTLQQTRDTMILETARIYFLSLKLVGLQTLSFVEISGTFYLLFTFSLSFFFFFFFLLFFSAKNWLNIVQFATWLGCFTRNEVNYHWHK